MQRLTMSRWPSLSGGLAHQASLLLLLFAALAGFFLLLEFVVALVSSGPRDILASTSSQERTFGVPSGVALLELLVLPVAIVLAVAALAVTVGWPPRGASFRLSWPLGLSVLAAIALVVSGAYLSFSGILGNAISYDEHMVQRTYLESGSLILLAAFFLSLTIAGILNWRLLAALLAVWLVAGSVFGLLDTEPIDGLLLFPRTHLLEVPANFAAAVGGFRQSEGASSGQRAEPAATTASSVEDTSLASEVTALQLLQPGDAPVFQVTDAVHTRYLRTATGDSYSDGTWSQLDRSSVLLDKGVSVPEAVASLAEELHLPTAIPLHEFSDQIMVSPIEGVDTLPAGVLPITRNLQSVDAPATYFPFSETLRVDSDVSSYRLEATLPVFALRDKVGAPAVADQTYLQLPDELPPRVHELAAQAGGTTSPYLKARLLQVYLQEEYAFGAAESEADVRQPPTGQDSVDWFLFDHRVGTSGNFSSAFAVLARAADIPARVVSGWVIARQPGTQTVHRGQTHQWAEIALDGLGWVTVDPVPRDAFADTDVNHALEIALEDIAASAAPEVRDAVAELWGNRDDPEALLLLFQAIDNTEERSVGDAARTTLSTLALDQFIGILLNHDDPLMRAAMAYGLEVLADPEAADALIQALAMDEDARVRAASADALAVLGKGKAEEPLLQALGTDQDTAVRAAAARALGSLGTEWTAERMLPVLLSDPASEVRVEVALALGDITENVALRPLLDARSDDASADVRAAAAEALDKWDYPALLEVLQSAEDPVQRAAAAQLMGERKYAAASKEMVPLLRSDPAAIVRVEIAVALGEIRNSVALRPLLDARFEDESAEVRAAAAGALANWDFDALLLILETAVDPLQRAAAAQLMGEREYSHTRALEALLYALATDQSAFVRAEVAYALGEIRDSVALRPLLDARSEDGSAEVRAEAVEALAKWDFSALLSTLEGAAEPAQRAAAAQLMGEQGYTEAIPALTKALADPAEEVRDAALEALQGLGADITTPDGSEGAGGQGSEGEGGPGLPLSAEDIASLAWANEETRGAALEALEGQGAEVTRLENGGAILRQADNVFFTFGTTTSQAAELPHIPVIEITGAAQTGYLRLTTGDVYESGGWRQLDPVGIPYAAGADVPEEVWERYTASSSGFGTVPPERRDSQSLFGFRDDAERVVSDRIRVLPAGQLDELPIGLMPTSPDLQEADLDGVYHPFSATFSTESPVAGYSWTSRISTFSQSQYRAAAAVTDPTYTQLPADMPARIRELAEQITRFHDSPYAKAKALEQYLSTQLTYGFANGVSPAGPSAGHDPVDWFLFDTRRGTCGQFSSAFVVLARSVGIPARVVGGWMVAETPGRQTVYTDQAHQWAEIALEGIGWVPFEPTAAGGAPSRVSGEDTRDTDRTSGPVDTVTNITRWPTEIRRQTPFVVGGTLFTASGQSVSDMTVEIYINETKEHGGTRIGRTTSRSGRFEAEVRLPADMELGGYQLLARAVGNDRFNESWSDPDIKVFSGNRIELAGPAEAVQNAPAVFNGRLIEDTGRGVAQRELGVTFDGDAASSVVTDSSGRFTFSESFSRLGQHWVEVQIRGEEFLLDNTARLEFQVVLPTETTVYVPDSVAIGEQFVVTGELRGSDGVPLAGKRLGVRVGSTREQSVRTDREGRFEAAGTASTAGEFTVSASFRGEGSVLASSDTARSEALHAVAVTLEGPLRLERGDGATFAGRVASDTFSPAGQVELTIAGASDERFAAVNVGEDGSFAYEHPSFEDTGQQTLMAHFAGGEFVEPASAEFTFEVLEPTVLTLDAPAIVRNGDDFRLTGTLLERNGRPVPNADVQVTDAGQPLMTDAEGRFSWDARAAFDEDSAHAPYESALAVEVLFEDTDHLASSRATLEVAVGLPRILVESLEPVARGGEAVLRGTVLLGTYPAPDAELTVGPAGGFRTNDVGTFTHPYPVSPDEPLGNTELVVAAPALDASVTVPLAVKSAANLIVTPVGRVRPGRTTLLQAALLDDTGTGIPGAALRSSQGVEAVTDDFGIAMLELAVPETEELPGSLVEFAYTGDDLHTPLAVPYFWEGAITPAGFNWLLWVGIPGLIALAAGAVFASRGFRMMPLPALMRRKGGLAGPVLPPSAAGGGEEDEEDAGPTLQPVQLQIAFEKAAPDLADVWGVGEEVNIAVSVTDEEGLALAGAIVDVSVADDAPLQLAVVGNDGTYTFSWSGAELGEYPVSVEFSGDYNYLPSSGSRTLRIVDFREEIVHLYGVFLDWARERAVGITEQSTPREVEVLLVTQGVPIPQKALDELISRFEEADYSEHPIERRHYEVMYRAWNAVVRDER